MQIALKHTLSLKQTQQQRRKEAAGGLGSSTFWLLPRNAGAAWPEFLTVSQKSPANFFLAGRFRFLSRNVLAVELMLLLGKAALLCTTTRSFSITKFNSLSKTVLQSVASPNRLYSKIASMSDAHKKAIAEQIAPLAGLEVDQIAQCVEEPRNKDNADLAVPIAKLNKFKKLPGNPAALASDWAPKVFSGVTIKCSR